MLVYQLSTTNTSLFNTKVSHKHINRLLSTNIKNESLIMEKKKNSHNKAGEIFFFFGYKREKELIRTNKLFLSKIFLQFGATHLMHSQLLIPNFII